MKIYETMAEAASEIKRDISKSPLVASASVQSLDEQAEAHEAMFYCYTVKDIPLLPTRLVEIASNEGLTPRQEEVTKWIRWLHLERDARLKWQPGFISEQYHPHLERFVGDERASDMDYTYTDRLHGAVEVMSHALCNPTTRRAFWPIFHPNDSLEISRSKRIPCSIGYQFLPREIGDRIFLHLVYFQRSCDFERFWLSDVWLAQEFQRRVLEEVNEQRALEDLMFLGYFTHFITSLHMFTDEEIY